MMLKEFDAIDVPFDERKFADAPGQPGGFERESECLDSRFTKGGSPATTTLNAADIAKSVSDPQGPLILNQVPIDDLHGPGDVLDWRIRVARGGSRTGFNIGPFVLWLLARVPQPDPNPVNDGPVTGG